MSSWCRGRRRRTRVNHHSISFEVDGIKDHHMEEQQEQHDEGHGNEAGPGREAQVANQDDKKMPMKRKGRANATRVIVDNEHLMIPCNIYQSWLHDTGDIVSKRGRKKEDFYREQNLFRSTRIGDLLELPLVPFIPGLEKFQDEVYYPAPLMDLLKKGAKKHTAHDSSLGGKSQGQTQAQVSHSPPEELYPPDLPEFRVDDFQSEIGSQTMHVSIEKLRANLENLNFQGLLDEHTGNSFVTPGSPGRSANSIPSSGSKHSVLPLEPVIQLPSGRSKRKQNSASTNSLGNLDPVGEDVLMQQSVRDFKLRKLTENVPTPDLELLEETEPTQTPGPKYVDSSIDKITQSIRTHLKVHFDTPGAPEFESLNQLAFGMNNKKAAQLFYQTCVLATHDFVKVQQTVPYGDITISRGPKM